MGKYRLVRRSSRLLKLGAINLLVLIVLLEIGSLGFYFLKTRHFFYPRNKDQIKATATQFEISEPGREDWMVNYQLHPYFGFIVPKIYVDLPFKKTSEDQFIVGIFGGSVAHHFVDYELKHHVLAQMLQSLPQLRNKEIVVLKFANPAHKQPQELLTLNYYLSVGQKLDMVINLDGFNELAVSYLNNKAEVEVSMPNGIVVAPMIALANKNLSTEDLALSLEVLQLKNKLQNTLNRLSECRLATCYTLRWAQAKYLFSQYQEKSQTLSQLKRDDGKDSLIYLKRVEKPLEDAELFERTLDIWLNSSLAMNDLLAARKIPYFEFIQPNQYYATKRQFSAAEKKVAFDDNSPFKEPTIKGYPKLLAKVSSLKDAGVKIFNAVNIFDETRDMVYEDNCCHYTDAGNEVFSRYIGQNIVTVLNTSPAPR
jgi:hypothetical protein